MKCNLLDRYRDAYVDEEVSPETVLEIEHHLGACPRCEAQVASVRALKQQLKTSFGRTVAPEGLRQRIATRLAEERRAGISNERPSAPPGAPADAADVLQKGDGTAGVGASGSGPWLRWAPLYGPPATGIAVLAAGALLTVVGPSFGGTIPTTRASVGPLLEDVVQLHSAELPADVGGEEPQVTRFFRQRVRFPVRPARFEGYGATLLGARLSNVRENRAAALYYDVGGRRVTVVVFDSPQDAVTAGLRRTRLAGQDLFYQRVNGYTVPVRSQNGLHYAFTGELDKRALLQLAASAQLSD